MLFLSLSTLNFYSTSRRDDLYGVCYMILYMLCHNNLPMLSIPANIKIDNDKRMRFIKTYKESFSLNRMCSTPKSIDLSYFCMHVENMQYDTEPNYRRLRKILEDLYMYEMNKGFSEYYEKFVFEKMKQSI